MLKIVRAKPNPAGKDRLGAFTPHAQLAGEWIDIQNTSSSSLNIGGLQVYNIAYTLTGPQWREVTQFPNFTLPPTSILRLHSGGTLNNNQMHPVDISGANYHFFTGKNYVWNNNKPDQPTLFNPQSKVNVDQTSYNAPVTEGKILNRNGTALV